MCIPLLLSSDRCAGLADDDDVVHVSLISLVFPLFNFSDGDFLSPLHTGDADERRRFCLVVVGVVGVNMALSRHL